ncbi:Rab-GTPase-TBC domain protein [Kalmanozyma brasiliensis GHG001]|uniref:Rab-GAP TBC domain-containing protein n=1 Tax=Kalmanozyma brasiliensis (strain GHG001) TaxID=1365824 RepID=V5ETB9_KALBG|nr:Rab-GTPase-TBC domain protein [Kalmanozyma brasiliensis GHG001]EST08510.1 Rab-GTPase-TBC domain protein [Kalmanozyma brasiliensis GHG001]
MDAHTLNAWTRFALQKGGIGSCTALIDNPATEPEDLMFMAGEKIIVLRRLDDDASTHDSYARPTSSTSASLKTLPESEAWFLGYCEGVVGRFKGAHVQFHGRLKKPVLMRRSAAGSIRDSSMRPMSKSEAAKMHLSQVPAGIPFTAVNSDGEEDSGILSPVDRSTQMLSLPTPPSAGSLTSSSNVRTPAGAGTTAAFKQGRFGLNTPPPSDEDHLRKQPVPQRPSLQDDDEDSDDSTSMLPWARHSRASSNASSAGPASKPVAVTTRNGSLIRPVAPSRSSSVSSNLPTIQQMPPSPISSTESPVALEPDMTLPSITTTSSSRSNSRSGNTSGSTTLPGASTPADFSRTSFTSSNSTVSTNDDSDDEQAIENRRRDYALSIYDVYGRDSVAFPNFDFRQHGSNSSLAKLAASKSKDSLYVPSQRSSSATDDRLQLPPSPQQRPQHLRPQQPPAVASENASAPRQQQQQGQQQQPPMQQVLQPRRPGQLTISAPGDPMIPAALRSPSGRRPNMAPDPRSTGVHGARVPPNMASSLRRQVETPPATTAATPVSPLDAAGAALAGHPAAGPPPSMRGPGAFDPRRRPSGPNTTPPARMQPNGLPPIFTGAPGASMSSTATTSNSGSSSSPPGSAGTYNSQDPASLHRPGFAEARDRRRSVSIGTPNKVENLEFNQRVEGMPGTSPEALPSPPMLPGLDSAGRPNFRTSAGSARSRTGPATSPGLGPTRASSDRLSERERAHSGQGSGLLRKNPSNPTPGLHGGSGLHGLAPMTRSMSPMSQLSAPSPIMDGSRRGSAASTGAFSTGPRSPQVRSPLGFAMQSTPSSAPVTPHSAGPHSNGFFGGPPSRGSVSSASGMPPNGFDAMGFIIEPGVPPCMPLSDEPELREKWASVLNENDVVAAKKSRKVKKLVRTGVPASMRRDVWLFLAEASVRRRPGLFEQLCKTSQAAKGKKGKEEAYDTIEKDLHRTLPDHRLFMGDNATGRADLEGILKSYVHFNPMLGYTQGMGLLAGFALLQMPAEDAFWLLCAVLRNPQMEEYYSTGMKQLHVDSVVFDNLLKTMDPELHGRFEEVGLQSIMFAPNWFLPLFTRVLPWTTLVRVWDVFFYEGPTWLLRVALAIVRILREQLMNRQACPSAGEMLQLLLHPPPHNLTVENVLNCAFTVKLKDGEMRKLSRTASKLVREKNFLNQPADARGRASVKRSGKGARSTSAPAKR